jgi:hypothetical protein
MENPFKPSRSLGSGISHLVSPNNGKMSRGNSQRHFPEYNHEEIKSSYATDNGVHTLEKGFNLSSGPSTAREKNPRDSLIADLHQAVEIKNMINQIRPVSKPSGPDLTSLLMSLMFSRNDFDPSNFLYLVTTVQNKNFAFRGNVCANCSTWWIDILFNNEGEMKSLLYTKSTLHRCDPMKVADAKKVQEAGTKKIELENQLVMSLLSLICFCSIFKSKTPYLEARELIFPPNYAIDLLRNQSDHHSQEHSNIKVEESIQKCWIEGEEVNCNPVDVDLAKVEKNHWAYRAIDSVVQFGKSSLEIDNNELIAFLGAARGTIGVRTTDIGEDLRHFLMYISFR